MLVKIAQRVEEFKGNVAQAGFFPGQAYADGTPIAYVGAIQEYGDPSHNIPSRSFMRAAAKEDSEHWSEDMKRGLRAVLRGTTSAENVLEQVGGAMAADIQAQIAAIDSPPLSPITVMLRGMRRNDPGLVVTGKTVGEAARRVEDKETNYGASTKPLVDLGIMEAAVTSKVGKPG